jgi:hypothetical protein
MSSGSGAGAVVGARGNNTDLLKAAECGSGIYVGSSIEWLSSGHHNFPLLWLHTETFIMIMTSFTTLFFVFLSLFTLSFAAPLHLDARDVFVPHITSPHAGVYFSTSFCVTGLIWYAVGIGTIWKVGEHYKVTWDTSNAPKHITNSKGKLLLADNGIQDVGTWFWLVFFTLIDGILADKPLAQNFEILQGHVVVKVPKVKPGKNYAVVRECKQIIWESRNMVIIILVQSLATREISPHNSRKFCVDILD